MMLPHGGWRDFEYAVAATLEGELAQSQTVSEWVVQRKEYLKEIGEL